MRKLVFAAAAATVALGAAAPAFAQDRAPFTGPRVEAIAGWDHVTNNGGNKDGVVYGGALGYDVQAGGAVVGIEGEVTGSTTKLRQSNVLVAGDRASVKAGRDLYIGARAGIAVTPTTLLYVKGGYSNARISTEYRAGNARVLGDRNLDGFRVGAGAEHQLNGRAYVKAEYRYSNYSDDFARHQVLGGVGVRF